MPQTKQRTRTRRLDPKVRRDMIIGAAAHLFERTDPAEVTFEEIADAAGVSRALVYNYFGDRGGLLAAVYLHTMDHLIVQLNDEVPATQPPVDRIRGIVRGYLAFASAHPAAWRLLQVTSVMRHPEMVAARRDHMEQLAEFWGGSATARIVAFGVVGMLEASTFDWLQSGDADIDELAAVLFDLLWFGLSSLDTHGIALPVERPIESVPT